MSLLIQCLPQASSSSPAAKDSIMLLPTIRARIHYGLYIVSRIIEEIRVNGDLDRSIREALNTSGKTVSFTAICIMASTAFWCFSSIRFDAVMGGLLAIWMLVSFVASETLTPVLIAYLRPGFIMREAGRSRLRPPVARGR